MIMISVPTTPQTVKPMLKRDEIIVCTNAIVTVDAQGQISWFDKNKCINIICKEGDPNERT